MEYFQPEIWNFPVDLNKNKLAEAEGITVANSPKKMKQTLIYFSLLFLLSTSIHAQLYFPPNNSGQWDTLSPATLGWCPDRIDSLYELLNANNSKAFILLKDGKIVLEKYFNGHTASSPWYWASAGKSLTSFLIGIAQREGFLNISDSTSKFLGAGWTSCTPAQEGKIRIRNQLSMTTGLDDNVADDNCTIDSCLQFLAEAGNRWAYHNAPYTLLDSVLRSATGRSINQYMNQKVKAITGMDGLFVKQEFNNVFYSSARSMARYGLLILNQGKWNNVDLLGDSSYFNAMVNSSQSLNPSYGYLWWLNGKSSFMSPSSQLVFPGSYNPDAPADMISGIGKNGQYVQVIPSLNMVWIRMGEAPDNNPVPLSVSNDIWKKIKLLPCNSTEVKSGISKKQAWKICPNPAEAELSISNENQYFKECRFAIFNTQGKLMQEGLIPAARHDLDIRSLAPGFYCLKLFSDMETSHLAFQKK